MFPICNCSCDSSASTDTGTAQQIYRYNPGVATDVPTPPAQTPNSLGIVPDDTSLPATCYPISTDGSGQTYQWNIELQSWV